MSRPALITVLLAATLALPGAARADSLQQGIINGEPATTDDWPATAQLIMSGTLALFGPPQAVTMPLCTATLIAPDVAMAAAHCLDTSLLTMGLGEVDDVVFAVSFEADLTWMMESQHQGNPPLPDDAVLASGWVAHPEFDIQNMSAVDGLANYNDMALVFLEEPVTDRDHAYLPTAEEAASLEEGMDVVIVGYGQRDPDLSSNPFEPPPEDSSSLRYMADSFINELGEHEFQVGDGPETSRKCHGDSGGPTYAEVETESSETWRVIGVTSRAYDSSDCQKGGVDMRADAFLDWIEQEIQIAYDNGWVDTETIPTPPLPIDGPEEAGCQRGCSTAGEGSQGLGLAWGLIGLLWLSVRRRGGAEA